MDRQVWAQDDTAGRVLAVFARHDPDLDEEPVAALRVSSELGAMLAHYLITPGESIEMTLAVHKACGLPVPVITPRPDIDPRQRYDFGAIGFQVAGTGVAMTAGAVTEVWAPSEVRRMAGIAVAVADASRPEPPPADPADAEELALVIGAAFDDARARGARDLDAEWLAKRLLACGVRLPGGDGGHG